jgi:hypothetical protein
MAYDGSLKVSMPSIRFLCQQNSEKYEQRSIKNWNINVFFK